MKKRFFPTRVTPYTESHVRIRAPHVDVWSPKAEHENLETIVREFLIEYGVLTLGSDKPVVFQADHYINGRLCASLYFDLNLR